MPDRIIQDRDRDDINNRFDFHPATSVGRRNDHEVIRDTMKEAALDILRYVPPGRERSTALTHLETAMFWSNAGIARQEGE